MSAARANAIAARRCLMRAPVKFERRLILNTPSAQLQTRAPLAINGCRNFSQSQSMLKKGGKNKSEQAEPAGALEDPLDFSALQRDIDKAHDRLKKELEKVRSSGQANPEIIEDIRVPLTKDTKAANRLGDLAQVLPGKKPRSFAILVASPEHVKHVQAAIRRASDSYGVELDTHNSSQLHVQIPAPTRESRAQAEAEAMKVGEAANVAIKNARAATQKWLRAIELKKTHRPDDLRKAHKEMEKVVDKGKASIKDIVSAAQKAMAR